MHGIFLLALSSGTGNLPTFPVSSNFLHMEGWALREGRRGGQGEPACLQGQNMSPFWWSLMPAGREERGGGRREADTACTIKTYHHGKQGRNDLE